MFVLFDFFGFKCELVKGISGRNKNYDIWFIYLFYFKLGCFVYICILELFKMDKLVLLK